MNQVNHWVPDFLTCTDRKQDPLWNKFQKGMENLFLISFEIQAAIIRIPFGSCSLTCILKERERVV